MTRFTREQIGKIDVTDFGVTARASYEHDVISILSNDPEHEPYRVEASFTVDFETFEPAPSAEVIQECIERAIEVAIMRLEAAVAVRERIAA